MRKLGDYGRGIFIGLLCALLIQVPVWVLGQGQNLQTGRIWESYWNLPSGSIFFIASGACPAGSTENADLSGKAIIGTVAANMNVGTTGGADTITPTVATLTAAAQAFSGSSANTSAVSAGTPAGTNGTAAFTPAGTNGTAAFTPAGTNGTASYTPAGTNGTVTGPAQVVSWPAGVPTNASGAFTEGAISWPAGVPTNGTVTGPAQIITWPGGVPTISGTTINSFSSVINHTHTITVTSLVQGGTTAATTGTHIMTSTATGGSARAPTSGDSFTATSANPSGGVASITPTINATGTIAWPAGVPTNGTSTIPAETISWPAGVPTIAAGSFTQPTISWPAGVPTNGTSTIPAETFSGTPATIPAETFSGTPGTVPAQVFSGTPGTVPAEVFSGSALGTHLHALTATGTNGTSAVTGTLNNFDNRSAFIYVIACEKS